MLSIAGASPLSFAPAATQLAHVRAAPLNVRMETVSDLKELATKCNPLIGYWNPLQPNEEDAFKWSTFTTEEAIGFLRQAEVKHGRVAMAAFVGFIVQSNGIHFPWNLNLEGVSYADIAAAGGPAAQWDALPTSAKLQILGFIGALEFFSESDWALKANGEKHYMKGGKIGYFPSFKTTINEKFPHPVPLDLFDPFGFSKNASPEKKAKGLVAEINNGRLAMIGIMAFVAEARVPGSVPLLKGLIAPYSGECMAPFSEVDAGLPFVSQMLNAHIGGF